MIDIDPDDDVYHETNGGSTPVSVSDPYLYK